jgi:hypothetical protein
MRAMLGAGCSGQRPREGPPLWSGALAVASAGAGRAARVELVEGSRRPEESAVRLAARLTAR